MFLFWRLAGFIAARAALWPTLTSSRNITVAVAAGLFIHPHGQGDAFSGLIDFQYFHFNNIAGFDHLMRIADKLIGQRGDMDQAILMHADINKGTKVGDVSDHPFQQHAGFEIGQGFHPVFKVRHLKFRPWIATGLIQLF